MLSTAAFNALLKTLEEPPSHVVFILATTDPQKVPETIHSRCQRFDFRRISTDSIVSRLGAICVAEDVEFEGEALELVAHRAEGGMRNALTSLEQLIAFGGGKVSLEVAERMLGSLASSDLAEIVRFVGTRDVASCFRWTAEFVETGADFSQFTRDFAEHVRNMYVMSLAGADVALDVSEAGRRELAEELKMFGPDRLARLLGVLGDLSAELKTSTNPRLSFEIALTRMVRPESDLTLEGLAERIERLEQGGVSFAHAVSAAPAGAGAGMPFEPAPDGMGKVSAIQQEQTQAQAQAQAQPRVSQAQSLQREAASPTLVSSASASELSSTTTSSAAAVPSAAAGTAASAGELSAAALANLNNPAALQRTWQQVLGSLKKVKAAYGVLFLNTKAIFEEESATFVIEFPAENDFAFKAVQKPDIVDELKKSLAHACGAPVNFRFTKAGGGASSAGFGQAAVSQSRRTQPQQQVEAEGREAAQAQQAEAANRVAAQTQHAARVQQTQQDKPSSHMAAQAQQESTRQQPAVQPQQQVVRPRQAVVPTQVAATPSTAHYDEVPVDIYDDYVPYDDEAWEPVGDPWAQTQPAPVSAVSPGASPKASSETSPKASSVSGRSAHTGSAAVGQTAPVASAPAAADSAFAASPATAEPSLDDLDAMLAFGFGAGVTFEEV